MYHVKGNNDRAFMEGRDWYLAIPVIMGERGDRYPCFIVHLTKILPLRYLILLRTYA